MPYQKVTTKKLKCIQNYDDGKLLILSLTSVNILNTIDNCKGKTQQHSFIAILNAGGGENGYFYSFEIVFLNGVKNYPF